MMLVLVSACWHGFYPGICGPQVLRLREVQRLEVLGWVWKSGLAGTTAGSLVGARNLGWGPMVDGASERDGSC